jgi:alpha-beta hydrolase superfamily lysophospholipase
MKNHKRNLIIVTLLLLGSFSSFAQDLKRQGSFGIQFAPVPDAVKAQYRLIDGQGILVQRVVPNSSAQEGGILAGDIILKINNTDIKDVAQFRSLAGGFRAGDQLQIVLLRDGKQLTKTFALKPRPFETHPDFDILYQAITVDGALRRVIITKPKTPGKHPAILLIPGVGCYSQENLAAYATILYTLTQKGFVTMRVEKTGMGDSEGIPCTSPQADLQAETRGYVAGLRALKDYPFVDGEQVFIFGHSMGGIIAPVVAAESPVKGLIVAETVGTSWFTYELENLRRQLAMRGVAYDEVEKIVRQKEYCNRRLYIDNQTPEQIAKDAPFCAQLPIQPPAPYTYMRQVAALNIAEKWKPVDAPVLVIYGTSDFQTSADEHRYLTDAINSFHPGRATYVEIPNMDHSFETVPSQREGMQRFLSNQPPGDFNPAILAQMQSWLDEILKRDKKI